MARNNPLVLIKKIAVDALKNPRDTAGKVIDTVSQIPIPGRRPKRAAPVPATAPFEPAAPATRATPPVQKAAPQKKAPAAKSAPEVTPAQVARNVHKQKPVPAPAVPGDKLPPRKRVEKG